MDIEYLQNQLDWIQARMEEMDKLIINYDPEKKGYEEALKNLNKLTDRYDELLDRIEHFDDPDIEAEKLKLEADKLTVNETIEQNKLKLEEDKLKVNEEIEKNKLKLEEDKLKVNEEIEQNKINLDSEKVRLDREKFAFDVEQAKKHDVIDIIFRTGELGAKIAIPILGFMGVRYVANLSYMNDEEMKLCNGRIAGGVKDMIKIMTMKV